MGAWIEITLVEALQGMEGGRPRMGAWIEIFQAPAAPVRSSVAPVWGRGLKCYHLPIVTDERLSPPYGGVD